MWHAAATGTLEIGRTFGGKPNTCLVESTCRWGSGCARQCTAHVCNHGWPVQVTLVGAPVGMHVRWLLGRHDAAGKTVVCAVLQAVMGASDEVGTLRWTRCIVELVRAASHMCPTSMGVAYLEMLHKLSRCASLHLEALASPVCPVKSLGCLLKPHAYPAASPLLWQLKKICVQGEKKAVMWGKRGVDCRCMRCLCAVAPSLLDTFSTCTAVS